MAYIPNAPELEEMARKLFVTVRLSKMHQSGSSIPVSSPSDSYYPPPGPRRSALEVIVRDVQLQLSR